MTLTPKQEAFARAYIQTGNASEAYRNSYSPKKMSESAIKVEASRLLKHPNVALTLERMQAKAAQKHEITVDSLVTELEEARIKAMNNPRGISAAVSATMGKAKLLGLVVDKSQVSGDPENPVVHTIRWQVVDARP